jgi:predicted TIM-barrel fold metal-dependent hydrolase
LSGALDRHPTLKLLSGHWGEFAAGWLDRLDGAFAKTHYLERTVTEYYRDHVWLTPSGMYTPNQAKYMLAEVGADRIIHSEDFPYVVRDDVSDFLIQADLTDEERRAIAHRNAEQLMRI